MTHAVAEECRQEINEQFTWRRKGKRCEEFNRGAQWSELYVRPRIYNYSMCLWDLGHIELLFDQSKRERRERRRDGLTPHYNIIWFNRDNWCIGDGWGFQTLVYDVCVRCSVGFCIDREREREVNVIELHPIPSITNIWAGDESGGHAQGARVGGLGDVTSWHVGLWVVTSLTCPYIYSCREGSDQIVLQSQIRGRNENSIIYCKNKITCICMAKRTRNIKSCR